MLENSIQGHTKFLCYLILILKDIKLDHQDFSNFKNTIMKIHTKFIYFFLVSSITICGQGQEIKDTKAISFASKEASLEALKNHKFEYEVTNLRSLNSKGSEFGVTDFGNSILFSSIVERKVFVKTIYANIKESFLSLYEAKKENISSKLGATSQSKTLFLDGIMLNFNESSVTFSPDKKTLYFTRNSYVGENFIVDEKGYNNLKIFKAEWVQNKWDNIVALPFCSNEYSVGHPSLSKDGKQLYFISDRPGGLGNTDLYKVAVKNDGTYGAIENLGTTVNTVGKEMFPFISDDDVLYFSSDGHLGMGALDVFSTKKIAGVYEKPVNLKAPVNTKSDDFSFSINPITKKGYLSSNREGGLGSDDIYAVEQLDEAKDCMQTVSVIVKESEFKKYLPYAKLLLKDNLGVTIKDTIADKEGRFSFNLPCNQKFTIVGSKEFYKSDTESFEISKKAPLNLDLDLFLKITEDFVYTPSKDLIIKINTIYFNYNKWGLRSDAVLELDHIVKIMKKYPKIIVASESHTDARGRSAYNQKLSQRRAEATADYIVSRGISSDRIYGKGYGESKLTNKCIDNDSHSNRIKCIEAWHQKNRRTSFLVLNVNGTKISSVAKEVFPVAEINNNIEKLKSNNKIHIVRRGQTLYSIGKRYTILVERLKKLNGLRNNIIGIGQVLRVK
jgi:outer membrane protein OmpA-like peptidoglycan-associated protein